MAKPPVNPLNARSAVTNAMKRVGPLRIRPLGMRSALWTDLYHELMRLTWPRLGVLFASCFLAFNLIFAGLYRLDPAGLAVPQDAKREWESTALSAVSHAGATSAPSCECDRNQKTQRNASIF